MFFALLMSETALVGDIHNVTTEHAGNRNMHPGMWWLGSTIQAQFGGTKRALGRF